MRDVKTCAFTGHRPQSLPFGFNETDERCFALKARIRDEVRKLIEEEGVTHFISGMALGVDMYSAEIVLDLKKEYPQITLECAIPCENQSEKWREADRDRYFGLVEKCDKENRTGRYAGRLIQVQNLPQNHLPDLNEVRSLIRDGQFDATEMLYDSVPIVLSELIRTAFIPKPGCKFFVADFSAIEARVIAWIAGEEWRQNVFRDGGDIYCASASQMFHVPVEKHGVNGHLRQKGKIAELALGYGGSVGALKAMGALNYGVEESELKPLVDAWRQSNPKIVKFWWDIDRAASACVKERKTQETYGIRFSYQHGMMFVTLPSGRSLAYVKPRMGENRFGNLSVTYEGVGEQKKWLRLESYGPKFVENIVQATARDILAESMRRLNAAGYRIVMHVHDEAVIEAPANASLTDICEIMGQTPVWAKGLLLRADGYVCDFYQKD